MDVDRNISYNGFTLIVKQRDGRIKGKAWPGGSGKNAGLTAIEFDADEVDAVINGLKAAVRNALFASLDQRHEAYLSSVNVSSRGRQFFVKPRLRQARCHYCGEEADNTESPECMVCGGIICLRCAACLCGTSFLINRRTS